jgi:hypothetical protein
MPLPQTLLGGALFVAVIAARLVTPQVRTDSPTAPVTALAHVPLALRRQPVLNDYDFGGYLIFQGIRPYIDGRTDMYGDVFMGDYNQIQFGNTAALNRAINHYGIGWAIAPPNLFLTQALQRAPGWKQIYADKTAVVLENLNPISSPGNTAGQVAKPATIRSAASH